MTAWWSWACRRCTAGWWGETMPTSCPHCGGPLVITGRGSSTPIE